MGSWNALLLCRARALGTACDPSRTARGAPPAWRPTYGLTISSGRWSCTDPVAGGHELTVGVRVRYRLPTVGDLVKLAQSTTVPDAIDTLIRRCVIAVEGRSDDAGPGDLPGEMVAALSDAIAAADPDAVLVVHLCCAECGQVAALGLDPVSFLWAEVDRWAWRLLADVHELALAYGWDERAILALTPHRRQAYLALAARDGHAMAAG